MQENSLEQRVRLGLLFDTYGELLTEKQQRCLELYFGDDFSLAEIADEMSVSRQAIHDLLKRVEVTLERYEDKLHFLANEVARQKMLKNASLLIDEYKQNPKDFVKLTELSKIIDILSGEGR